MMCLIEISDSQICKCIVGSDIYDLRRRALAADGDDHPLIASLRRVEFPPPGLTQLDDSLYLIVMKPGYFFVRNSQGVEVPGSRRYLVGGDESEKLALKRDLELRMGKGCSVEFRES